MITEKEFKEIYSAVKLYEPLMKIINRQLKLVNFEEVKQYRHGRGVEILKNNIWYWSWMNSINTNYTAIYQIIKFINQKETRKIKFLDFVSDKKDDTLKYIEECIVKYRQDIFTPGSEVFKNMFFATQWTWNRGIISTINCVLTLKTRYDIKCDNLNFERGEDVDMRKGTDMFLFFEDEFRSSQHKSVKITKNGNFYTSTNVHYNENTYRKNLDLLTFESDNEIHIFRNSKRTEDNLCGMDKQNHFFISEDLRIDTIPIEQLEIKEILNEMNNLCKENNVVFDFKNNESSLNYFEGNEKSFTFFLNDINDEKIVKIVSDKLYVLKQRFEQVLTE